MREHRLRAPAAPYQFTITATNGVGSAATQAFTLTVSQAPGITSPAGTTFTVGQAGTFTVTTTGVPTPGLSETGALPSGVTFTDNGDGTATLAGTPAAGLRRTIPVHHHRHERCRFCRHPGLHPDGQPGAQITSPAGTTFTVGQAGTFTVTSTGVPNAALSETGALPSGVTFTDNGDGTATLAGTPAAGSGGTYKFTITATNGVGSAATQAFTLTVSQAPGITSPAGTTFTVGQAGTFTVTTTGAPTPGLSETGALPSGVTFTDNGDGTATLAGTPAPRSSGTYPFTITATNGVSPAATQSFTLTVNQAPGITSPDQHHLHRRPGRDLYRHVDRGAHPRLVREGRTPAGSQVHGQRGRHGDTFGDTDSTGGVYTFRIAATNGVSPDATQSFTLTVVGLPAAPSGLKATGRGRSVSLTWTNNASTPSATGILIQRSTNAGFTTGIVNTTVSPTATTHIDTTVVKGKRYYYRVRAHNSVGNSAWSNVSNVTAP